VVAVNILAIQNDESEKEDPEGKVTAIAIYIVCSDHQGLKSKALNVIKEQDNHPSLNQYWLQVND
jgi:hypothetical protein